MEKLLGAKKKIVLVTSGQPSANPRLVKEATTLVGKDFDVTVIYCPLSPWADAYDLELFNRYSTIKWLKAGAHPTNQKFTYLYCRLRQKIFQTIYKFAGNRWNAGLRSITIFSQELESAAKKIKAHLYIGHNLGALPAVVKAAKLHDAKASFDFEDFHRGEAHEHSLRSIIIKETEDKFVSSLTLATAASPLIRDKYANLYPSLGITTVNNCFSVNHSSNTLVELLPEPVKLFWFSQTVGKSRGIEDIIIALKQFPSEQFELTLIGNCSSKMNQYFKQLSTRSDGSLINLIIKNTVAPNEIFNVSKNFHIGLALEPGRDLNNNIALSNKIFTYLLGGNAIIFSATPAQEQFYKNNMNCGEIYKPGDIEGLCSILNNYLNDIKLLNQHRENSLELGKAKYNWEKESLVFLSNINEALG